MNKLLLVGLLIGIAAGGVMIASTLQGTLATITYHITGSTASKTNTTIITIPANINLGNLTAGKSGQVKANAILKLSSSGYYEFKLNEGALKGEFSNFTVILKFANYTITLVSGEHEDHPHHHDHEEVYVPAGNYTVYITIYYTVSQNAHNETVSNVPLIIVKLVDHNEDENENS